jgi:hypothetical protein
VIDVPKRVIGLFEELIARGEEIKNTCKKLSFTGNKKAVDPQTFEAWKMSCMTLLRSTFGSSSPHYDSFLNLKFFDYYNSTLIYLGILQSAKDDIQKGYFYHKDLMLSVNLFTSFLAHAKLYVEKERYEKARGILETVVAESLKKLAERKQLPLAISEDIPQAIEKLLAAGVINQEAAKKLEALKSMLQDEGYSSPEDFSGWISWAHKFIYENLGSQIVILN